MEHSKATYALLRYIADHHDISLLNLINQQELPGTYTEKQALVSRLADIGLVAVSGREGDDLATRHLRLTGYGVDLLFRMEEVTPLQELVETLKEQAEAAEKEAKESKWIARLSILVSILSAFSPFFLGA